MTTPWEGLSAFPLTPLAHDSAGRAGLDSAEAAHETVDEIAFIGLVKRCAVAGVDSITVLGSTGSYAYLDTEERARVAGLAVEHAGRTPVFVGVGALRTRDVLRNISAAEEAGAAGLLLAPMSYQPLTDDDVLGLFRTVDSATDLPVIVYDNPGTTHFTFSPDLYGQLSALDSVVSIKIPGVGLDVDGWVQRLGAIHDSVGDGASIGISGDQHAAAALLAGARTWYSVIGGVLPEPALEITRAGLAGDELAALAASARLEPLWRLFAEFGGSLRVVAAIAEHLGLAPRGCLPLPIQGLREAQAGTVAEVVARLGLN